MAKKKDESELPPPIADDDDMDMGVFVPEIPMPDENVEEKDIIEDKCDAAFKFAFIGAGQGGARIVEAFYKMGYRRVCAVNTTDKDLIKIDIPEENKLVMDIGEGGAGKNPSRGEEAAKKYYEDIYDLMRRSFGKEFDRILVCVGAGGGSGSGAVQTIIKIAHDIAESFKLEKRKMAGPQQQAAVQNQNIDGHPVVGCLVSMPMTSEGQKVNANAAKVLDDLFKLVGKDRGKVAARSLSPLIIVDNERIDKMHPNLSVDTFWPQANASIVGLFHLFNSIATKESEYTTFDRADLNDVLKAGIITFGATPLRKFDGTTDISFAVRDNLRKNVLVSDINLGEATTAACVFIGHPDVMKRIPQNYLEHGFEMLSRIMQDNSVVHRGIYRGKVFGPNKEPGLVAYTIIGELGRPEERMDEICRIGGVAQQPR